MKQQKTQKGSLKFRTKGNNDKNNCDAGGEALIINFPFFFFQDGVTQFRMHCIAFTMVFPDSRGEALLPPRHS